jgi:hypothetical protein
MKEKIVEIFKSKGWGLYKVTIENNNDLPMIVENGKVDSVEVGFYYHILPLVSIDFDLNEILDNLEIVQKRNEQPKYRTSKDDFNIFVLDGFEVYNDYINLCPAKSFGFSVKVKYENIVNTLNSAISANNVFYFDSIDTLIGVVGKSAQENPILDGQVRWELMSKENSDQFVLLPSEPNLKLFRGQTKRYQPCFPSVSRHIPRNCFTLNQLTKEEQSKLLINLIKAEWFCETLSLTPQFEWANGQKYFMDKMALAQHYELPTGYLDLSQSIHVASFFACCRFEDGVWHPMISGEGVIYTVDLKLMDSWYNKIKPIGQQIFPRPSEQWGWTYETYLGEDFDSLPFVRKHIFQHNEISSKKILNSFKNGATIFPNDPLYSLAEKIKSSQKIPYLTTLKLVNDLIQDEKGFQEQSNAELMKQLSEFIEIDTENIEILDTTLKQQFDNIWNNRKNNFFENIGGIGFRLLRTKRKN